MLRNRFVIHHLTVLSSVVLVSTMLACGSHPLYTQVDCGNGVIDGAEECDGDALGGESCTDLGFATGTLACNSQCTFDTSDCSNAGSCGDGTLDAGEQCDGAALDGATCETLGWDGGTLGCDTSCHYDVGDCEGTGPVCGNDIQETGEQCDGQDLAGEDCTDRGYTGGTLACDSSCDYDETGCYTDLCGNGVVDTGEQCDGADLNNETCQTQGWDTGALACDGSCQFDESQCAMIQAQCGDGVVTRPDEECDGSNFDGETCQSLGFQGGNLQCDNGCHLRMDGCWGGTQSCGDGLINQHWEECDTTEFWSETCQTLGYQGGTLTCDNQCQHDVSQCTGGPTCSDTGGTLTCNTSLSGETNVGAPDQVDNWFNCVGWPLTGPEVVYTLSMTGGSFFNNVNVDVTGLGADLDLMVLSSGSVGCDPALYCEDHSANQNNDDEHVSFQYTPGTTYYIVVDGWDGGESSYDISVSCSN